MNPEEIDVWAQRVESELQDLGLMLQELQAEVLFLTPLDARTDGRPAPEVDLGVLDLWVSGLLLDAFRRHVTPSWRFCPQWWDHPEAVIRLEALRRSWEASQSDPTGRAMLQWLQSLDQQLGALSDPSGTLAACTEREHRPAPPFVTEPIPGDPA